MKGTLLALVLLTSVEKAGDGSRLVLGFDAPAQISQMQVADPPRLVLDLPGAAASPAAGGPQWQTTMAASFVPDPSGAWSRPAKTVSSRPRG